MQVPNEITTLIQNSGNNFHAKVARWFTSNGWHTTISPYYFDRTQNKAREIDLIAEKSIPMSGRVGDPSRLVVRLFVECKFVPAYSVFWFTDRDMIEAERLVCGDGVFRPNNSYTSKHHYLSREAVAKVFASGRDNADNDPFYKALNQSLNALISMRRRASFHPDFHDGDDPELFLDFPVVVCSAFEKMWSVKFDSEGPPSRINDNFQLEVRYASSELDGVHGAAYFLLDFVEFDRLQAFTEAVEKDAQSAAYLASRSSEREARD